MRVLTVSTGTHGRVLVEDPADEPAGLLVLFHGYGQSAERMLEDVRLIPGADAWRLASVQALHQFYARDSTTVLGSWMTRQNRDLAIADNIEYVDRAVAAIEPTEPIVFAGFSQGVAMAYRAAVRGRHPAAGILALAGDIPPELKERREGDRWPPVLIGVGDRETWYAPAKVDNDRRFLATSNIAHEIVVFNGGHDWTDEFRQAAGRWLRDRASSAPRHPSRARASGPPDPSASA
jgi:predicted esterase